MKYLRFMTLLLVIAALAFNACGGDGGGSNGDGGTTPLTDAEAVIADAAALDAEDIIFTGSDTPSNVTGNFTLPTSGLNGTTISWVEQTDTGNSIALSGTGNSTAVVTWPEKSGFGPYTVTLKATITKGTETTTKDISVIVTPPATTKILTTVDSVTFKMVLVPGGKTFPIGRNDEGSATVENAYWIGETEVTYELWNKVYTWATDAERGPKRYEFANAGTQGDNGSRGIQHPVTDVNWRDSMVWCNALTEWYNAQKGTSYECVYNYEGFIIRSSDPDWHIFCDNIVQSSTAKGFRLLTSNEHELAARYRDGILWTYGDHVSGDDNGACYDDGSILGGLGMSTVFGNYAVYSDNSGSSTAVVKSKTNGYNALGLYDMSGNVWEWCFDRENPGWNPRIVRSGDFTTDAYALQVGSFSYQSPFIFVYYIGFRFARTQ